MKRVGERAKDIPHFLSLARTFTYIGRAENKWFCDPSYMLATDSSESTTSFCSVSVGTLPVEEINKGIRGRKKAKKKPLSREDMVRRRWSIKRAVDLPVINAWLTTKTISDAFCGNSGFCISHIFS